MESSSCPEIATDQFEVERKSNRRRKRPFPQHLTPRKRSCVDTAKSKVKTESSNRTTLSDIFFNTDKTLISQQINSTFPASPSSSLSLVDFHCKAEPSKILPNVLKEQMTAHCLSSRGLQKQNDDQNFFCENEGSNLKKEISPKKASPRESPKKSKGLTGVNEVELSNIIEGMNDEINNMLEETAERNKLTATNVKNILRHVISNEYVLAMVRNTMKSNEKDEEELEEAVFEPKLTRSKAKELREKKATLPWPVSSPAKQCTKQISKKLLEEEFSENDSDEEYQPNEEECHSDEEEPSSKGSITGSPSEKHLMSSPEKIVNWDNGEPPLVIADVSETTAAQEADLIALRTRSKLPLVDTPLETIEASFVAPDITVDMYDTECDDEDWQQFLLDISKPLDTKTSLEQPDDDVEDDPEYNVLEEEEDDDDKKAVKISQKELNALMASIFETAEQELIDWEEEDEEDLNGRTNSSDVLIPVIPTQPEEIVEQYTSSEVLESPDWFTPFERLQLEEQLRMHVQLLTQSYILSYGICNLGDMTNSTLSLLEELKVFSCRVVPNREKSYFYADNLDDALAIVHSYESEKALPMNISPKSQDGKSISVKARTTMAQSKVFIYPHLLPTVGFKPNMAMKSRVYFTEAEDRLLALGLEQFSVLNDPIQCIQSLLLPTKSVAQIKLRIKNLKGSKGNMNPVKYFYLNEQAPLITPIVRPYDPATVKRPCDLPTDCLPSWMLPHVMNRPPLAPALPQPPKVAVVHPLSYKTSERRRYQRILPRVSSFKKISPFLKKYGHHRRIVPVAPLTQVNPSLSPELPVKQTSRMIPIRPKPSPQISISALDSPRMISIRPRSSPESQHIPILPKPTLNDLNIVPMTVESCFLPVESHLVEASLIPSTIVSSVITPVTSAVIGSTITSPITSVESTQTTTLQPEPNFVNQNVQVEIKPEHLKTSLLSTHIMENVGSEPMYVTLDAQISGMNEQDKIKPKIENIEEAKSNQHNIVNIKEQKMESEKKNQETTLNKREKVERNKRESSNKRSEVWIQERCKTVIENKRDELRELRPSSAEKTSLAQNRFSNLMSITRAGKAKSASVDSGKDKFSINEANVGKEKFSASSNVNSFVKEKPAANIGKEKSSTPANITSSGKEKSVTNEVNTGKSKHTNIVNSAKDKSSSRSTVTQNDSSQHAETNEDADEEAVDDEQDLAALMVASSTICKKQTSSSKKKNKHQRDLESTLQLLVPNILENDPKREEREQIFAQSYLLRVMEALKNDPTRYENFLKLLCSYQYSTRSPTKLFLEIQDILRDHPTLVDEFVGFLSAEQARECGKFIEYNTLNKIRVFLRKIEIHFGNQPHHIQRILKTLGQIQNQANLTSSAVISALQPLLRNQSHLLEEFFQLLPDEAPPESLMTDFEEVTIPLSDGDNSSVDSFEEVTIPEVKDPYGGKDCPCPCHSTNMDVRAQNKNKHCVKCGTKFIDGRIYIQTGKVLKPAQVIYSSINPPATSTQTKTEAAKTSFDNSSKHPSSNERHRKETQNNSAESRHSSATRNVSSFPCDVTEDAVLPPVSGSSFGSSIPSDFSHLQEAITSHAKNSTLSSASKESNKHITVKITENTNNSLRLKFTGTKIEPKPLKIRPDTNVITSIQRGTDNWSREQDKIILDTCKTRGINKESFRLAATKLPGKTADQCENRLQVLMQRLEQHLKNTKR